jgi:serine/threonine protein kinase
MKHYSVGMLLSNTYELVAKLGQGGMGEVWVAKNVRLPEKPLAIKVIYHNDPSLLERLRREAKIMAGLNHPHIAQIIDLDTLPNGHPFMVMELLLGSPLSIRIGAGNCSQEEIDRWLYQLGDALNTAHQHGIIHRDLKPDNLFLCEDGTLKVLDFGLSKISHMGRLSVSGALMGTPLYMSPEQVEGEEVDERSDLFALGLITIELITNQRPISGDSLPKIFKAIRQYIKPPCPDGFSQSRWAIIDKAIAYDPKNRCDNVAQWIELFIGKSLPERRLNVSMIGQKEINTSAHKVDTLLPTIDQALETVEAIDRSNQSIPETKVQIFQKTHSSAALDMTHEEMEVNVTDSYARSYLGHLLYLIPVMVTTLYFVGRPAEQNVEVMSTPIPVSHSDERHSSQQKHESKKELRPLEKVELPEEYKVAIKESIHETDFKNWGALILFRAHIRRVPKLTSQKLSRALELLKQHEFIQFEYALKEVIALLDQDNDELIRVLDAMIVLSKCRHSGFRAQLLYDQLDHAEKALIEAGLTPCKSKFFKLKQP